MAGRSMPSAPSRERGWSERAAEAGAAVGARLAGGMVSLRRGTSEDSTVRRRWRSTASTVAAELYERG